MAGIPFLHNIDLKDNQLLNAKLHTSGTAPANPGTGTIWYDSDNSLVKIYNSGWTSIAGDITGVSITAGDGLSGTVATTAGAHTQTLLIDISEYSDVTPANGDKLLTLDSDGSTEQLTTVAALAALFAGSGLTATNSVIAVDTLNQDTTGTATNATNAAHVLVTDNESTSENNLITFVEDGTSSTGNVGLEMDGNLYYNPSSGTVTATAFAGNITGNVTGNLIIGGHTVDDIDITSEASDADDHLMTALAIKNRIEDYGYTTDANVTHRTITAGGNTLAGSETLAFTAGSNISISESAGAVTITGTDTNTNTGADMTNATLLTKLAALESTSGAADENIVIGTDSGDTIVITGNLQVSGTTTTVDSTTVTLGDHNIVLDSGNSTSAVVADAGITLEGGSGDDVTWMWDASNTAMTLKLGSSLGDAAFGTIELGHATDTTIARSGSGDITIEGNAVYRAGGTDVPVADGGTGASTLTDGGVLLGSGTGAITAMAVLADGEMIVGDGTTDPVAESGATLRTSIGVDVAGTDNSTNVTLAGTPDYITISGQQITRNAIDLTADVTGVLPAANLPDAGAAAEGVVELATASEVQTGTDAARVVTADTLAAKSVTAVILTASLDGTENSAVINHALDTTDLIVQAQMIQETGESAGDYNNCIIDWECTTDGSTNSDNHIYVKFADAPPYDVTVNITSIKGATAITPTYPS